jgi:hypothetical protein
VLSSDCRDHARTLGLDGPLLTDLIMLDCVVGENSELTYAAFNDAHESVISIFRARSLFRAPRARWRR